MSPSCELCWTKTRPVARCHGAVVLIARGKSPPLRPALVASPATPFYLHLLTIVELSCFCQALIASRDRLGGTAAHEAAAAGRLAALQLLIAAADAAGDEGFVNVVDRNGQAPLHAAAGSGHVACVQWLLQNTRADRMINRAPKGICSPLHYAATYGHVARLVSAGHFSRLDAVLFTFHSHGLDFHSRVLLLPIP